MPTLPCLMRGLAGREDGRNAVSIDEKNPGTFQCIDSVTIAIEEEDKPALIAIWVIRFLFCTFSTENDDA